LIAVVVVLGILAALAVPTFNSVKTSSLESVATRSGESILSAAKAAAAFEGLLADDLTVKSTDGANVTYLGEAAAEAGMAWDETSKDFDFVKDGKTYVVSIDDDTTAGTFVVSAIKQ
jgi:type II secretory pathway pseudopilin PulG